MGGDASFLLLMYSSTRIERPRAHSCGPTYRILTDEIETKLSHLRHSNATHVSGAGDACRPATLEQHGRRAHPDRMVIFTNLAGPMLETCIVSTCLSALSNSAKPIRRTRSHTQASTRTPCQLPIRSTVHLCSARGFCSPASWTLVQPSSRDEGDESLQVSTNTPRTIQHTRTHDNQLGVSCRGRSIRSAGPLR